MKSVVLNNPITVGGHGFESWDPKRMKQVDCIKVGDVLYFIPIVYAGDVAKRDLEGAKAVHIMNVKEWAPSVADLPEAIVRLVTDAKVAPIGGKK